MPNRPDLLVILSPAARLEPHRRVRAHAPRAMTTKKRTVVPFAPYKETSGGWPILLNSLKTLLETGEPLPTHLIQ